MHRLLRSSLKQQTRTRNIPEIEPSVAFGGRGVTNDQTNVPYLVRTRRGAGRHAVCGRSLNGSRAFYHALADGLVCIDDKRVASSEMSPESRKIAAQMLRSRVSDFAEIDWPKVVAADLRKYLLQILERHLEKKLVTAGMLDKIGS